MNIHVRPSIEFTNVTSQQMTLYLESTRNILETYEVGDEYMEALSQAIEDAEKLLENPYISTAQKETNIRPYIANLRQEKFIQDLRWEEIVLQIAREFNIDWLDFIDLYRAYQKNPLNLSIEYVRADEKSDDNLLSRRMSFLQRVISIMTNGKHLGELGFSRRTPNTIPRLELQ